eukprot:s385_g2.t1
MLKASWCFLERLLGSQFFDVIPPVTGGRTTWDLICQILWCLMTKHRVRERCLQRKLSRRFVWYLGSECRDAVCDGLQILDGSQLPLNTNDGLTEGFRLVERAELAVRATRSPPMAAIDVNLVVDPKSSQPDELILVAPLGFNFTPWLSDEFICVMSCSFNRVTSCQLHGNVAGRASARLTVARLTSVLEQVVIKVTTPAQNPPSTSWFINEPRLLSPGIWPATCSSRGERKSPKRCSGSGLGVWLPTGISFHLKDPSGVLIRQMLGAHVLYPGIPQIPGQMAFSFITNEKIESGGAIRVGYPTDIEVLCNGLYLSQVAITGEVTCMNFIQEGYFELRLDRPLPPGQQAFTVTSTCPAAVNDNVFYIIILTPTGQVSDAAMSIPGLRIQHGLPISAMPLIWGMAEPNRNTFVSTGIELLAELPLKDPPIMSEIIIEMPPDFSHQVQKTAQLETLTEPLPRREGGWLDVTDPRRLRLLMDEEAIQKLAIGSYRFQWPIMVPAVMPKYNIWELTVCSPAIRNESCTGSDDPRALVSFPLAGFGMGESHPSSIAFTQTGDASLVRANWSVLALLAAVAWRHARACFFARSEIGLPKRGHETANADSNLAPRNLIVGLTWALKPYVHSVSEASGSGGLGVAALGTAGDFF